MFKISTTNSRVQNCIGPTGIPVEVLRDSQISLLSVEGNPILPRQLAELDGMAAYQTRFTAAKKKGD